MISWEFVAAAAFCILLCILASWREGRRIDRKIEHLRAQRYPEWVNGSGVDCPDYVPEEWMEEC